MKKLSVVGALLLLIVLGLSAFQISNGGSSGGAGITGTPTANHLATWANASTLQDGGLAGGSCTNQAVTSISSGAVPTCTTLTSSYVDTSIAKTGTDINTSNQVTGINGTAVTGTSGNFS